MFLIVKHSLALIELHIAVKLQETSLLQKAHRHTQEKTHPTNKQEPHKQQQQK